METVVKHWHSVMLFGGVAIIVLLMTLLYEVHAINQGLRVVTTQSVITAVNTMQLRLQAPQISEAPARTPVLWPGTTDTGRCTERP